MAWLSGYSYRIPFIINKVDGDITNYPHKLYLTGNASEITAGGGSGITLKDMTTIFNIVPDADKLKIAVTTSDGETPCYVEVVSWDAANKQAELYTKINLSSSATTTIYFYFGAANANTTYVGATGSADYIANIASHVWDSNYVAVYHMNDGADTSHIYDSTSNVNYGTKYADGNPAVADGLKGKGQTFSGSNVIAFSPSVSNALTGSGYSTVSIIAKQTGDTSIPRYIIRLLSASGNARHYLASNVSSGHLTSYHRSNIESSSTAMTSTLDFGDGSYHSATTKADLAGHMLYAYLDGGAEQSQSVTAFDYTTYQTANTHPGYIGQIGSGDSEWIGIIDELRISNTARSAAWIKATNYSERDTNGTWGSIEPVLTATLDMYSLTAIMGG